MLYNARIDDGILVISRKCTSCEKFQFARDSTSLVIRLTILIT